MMMATEAGTSAPATITEKWDDRVKRLLGDDYNKIDDTTRPIIESLRSVGYLWGDGSVEKELRYVLQHGKRWHPEAGTIPADDEDTRPADPDRVDLDAVPTRKRRGKPQVVTSEKLAGKTDDAPKAKPVRGRKKTTNGEAKVEATIDAKAARKKLVPGKKVTATQDIDRERKGLQALVEQLVPKHSRMGEIRGEISGLYANSVDAIQLHKKAFRDAYKLRRQIDNDEGLKAADYLRAFHRYCELLDIEEDTKDLFDNIDKEVGRQQDDADGAIA